MKLMTHHINDVIKVNIKGTIVAGIILSDMIIDHYSRGGERYLLDDQGDEKYVIRTTMHPGFWLSPCYLTLIGDEKVYVEEGEIYQNEINSPQ